MGHVTSVRRTLAPPLRDIRLDAVCIAVIGMLGCGQASAPPPPEAETVPEPVPELTAAPYRVYVTNERSGDLTVIAGGTHEVVAGRLGCCVGRIWCVGCRFCEWRIFWF